MGTCLRIGIITFLLISCKPPLQEIRSTRQQWCVESKNLVGINYHFTVKTMADYTKLRLDSIWLHGKWVSKFHYSVLGKANTDTAYFKNDTILISINMMDTLFKQPIILHFTINSKNKKISITRLTTLKSLCQ